jgi:hypothetical protein
MDTITPELIRDAETGHDGAVYAFRGRRAGLMKLI